MNRSNLLWFAAGAASCAAASVAAQFLASSDDGPRPYLVIKDRLDLLNEMKNEDRREVASLSAKMIRECGAREFEMASVTIDDGGYTSLPITAGNLKSFKCVFDRAAKGGFELDIWIKTDPNA